MRLVSITLAEAGAYQLRVYEINHAALSLKPNTDGSARSCFLLSASAIAMKFSAGMDLRAFQLLTAGRPRPSRSAAADVPPSASMMSSTELSMVQHSLHTVNLSRVATPIIDTGRKSSENKWMDSDEVIGERLRLWVIASNLTPKQVYENIGCTKGAWSAYTNGKRHLTLDIASKLRERFGPTLDWIYYGNFQAGMHPHLAVRMKEISDDEARGIFIGRTRPPAARNQPAKLKASRR